MRQEAGTVRKPPSWELTHVALVERHLTEAGLPRRLGLYEIRPPRKAGRAFYVQVVPLREVGLHVPYERPVELKATSAQAAYALVLRRYRRLAEQMRLDLLVSEAPGPGRALPG